MRLFYWPIAYLYYSVNYRIYANFNVSTLKYIISGKFYEEYLSIPFAAPPVDELRWEKPQPVEPWEPEVWNGTEFSMHCTQFIAPFYKLILMGARSGEDCLYLNIWVPKGVSANKWVDD